MDSALLTFRRKRVVRMHGGIGMFQDEDGQEYDDGPRQEGYIR